MNRAERRKQIKGFTPHEFEKMERQIRWAIKKEYEDAADRRVQYFIRNYTTLVIYVLWYKFGMGKKRIGVFTDELHRHLDIISEDKKYGLTLEDMHNMLKNEADIDLQFLDDGQKIDKK